MSLVRTWSARAAALAPSLEARMPRLMLIWVVVISFACGIRSAFPVLPAYDVSTRLIGLLPYALVIGAPIASMMLALRWFRKDGGMPQPGIRLACYGRWETVSAETARMMPLFGAGGIMASLLVGLLLNLPVRTLEFLAAIPPIGVGAPHWFATLFLLMLADVVLFCSLYAIAFAAALRHVPLFPRLLVAIWGLDVLMQLSIAQVMVGMDDLPREVAVGLHGLLSGNLKKVLISAALWAPYLLLSRRVNLTYRLRIPVDR